MRGSRAVSRTVRGVVRSGAVAAAQACALAALLVGLAGPGSASAQLATSSASAAGGVGPAAPAASATPPADVPAAARIPARAFFAEPRLASARLSPDGRRLALSMRGPSGRQGLMVLETGAPERPGRFYAEQNTDLVEFHWTGNDQVVYSVRDLQRGVGERYGRADEREVGGGLFAMDVGTGDGRTLISTRLPGFYRAPPIGREALDPRYELLWVPPRVALAGRGEVIVGHLSGRKEVEAIEPVWLDTRRGATRSVDTGDTPRSVLRWWFDAAGVPRAAESREGGRTVVHLRDPDEGGAPARGWQRIVDAPPDDLPFQLVQVEADGTLWVTVASGPRGWRVLTTYDRATRAPSRPFRVSVPGFDFRGGVLHAADDGEALGVRVNGDAESTVWFHPAMKRLQETVDARLPGRVNRLSCVRCRSSDAVVLVRSFRDNEPGRLLLLDAASGRWSNLGDVQEGIDPRAMATVDLQHVRARDGLDLPVWVTRPQHAQGRALPTVVLVHGGPWVRSGFWAWEAMPQFLASRGWQVLDVEFRGSSGYGTRHLRAGFQQWGRAMQDDLEDALAWARKQGLADDRACIAGASYGGYASLMAVTRDPQPFRCAAAWVAVTDLDLYLRGGWFVDDDISSWGRENLLPERVGDPVRDAQALRSVSPVHLADRIRVPVLMAVGESDRRVPLRHGESMREALARAGNPPEWIAYPGEGHGWGKLSTRVDFAERLEAFLARHLNR